MRSAELKSHLEIIYADGALLTNAKVKNSVDEAQMIALELSDEAKATSTKCKETVTALTTVGRGIVDYLVIKANKHA